MSKFIQRWSTLEEKEYPGAHTSTIKVCLAFVLTVTGCTGSKGIGLERQEIENLTKSAVPILMFSLGYFLHSLY